ncbi:PhnA domain-containing protein [Hyphococcus lacteus]|uniref:PhnA domain-containing protein n=1 Tax=Hyphococcus lacteus TaxID=3143536 RepID=A0ABV3Z366_9PROT
MAIENILRERAGKKCELCANSENLSVYFVPPHNDGAVDKSILACATCTGQIMENADIDVHHWRNLNDSAWSQIPAVQVVAWRMLSRLRDEAWARDLLEILYLDDATAAWAQSGIEASDEVGIRHIDSNGTELAVGDSVVLIKDLNVKGAGFTAKRGTVVRNISLSPNNAKHIEGRVNSQQIVILTEFVKKSN